MRTLERQFDIVRRFNHGSNNAACNRSKVTDPRKLVTTYTLDGLDKAAYTYDARGRLIQVVSAAGTTTYQINALGQRVRKTLVKNGTAVSDTVYHYDLAGQLIGESRGALLRDYVWLDDTPVAIIQ